MGAWGQGGRGFKHERTLSKLITVAAAYPLTKAGSSKASDGAPLARGLLTVDVPLILLARLIMDDLASLRVLRR